jgi:excinuclease UvrABC ATPase subunit
MKILEYKKYKGDPYWFKAKRDGVSGEQRLPEQRRFKKGGERFKKGDEVLFFPKGKIIMVGKKAEQAWREFEAAASDEDFYMSQYEGTEMKLQEKYDNKEYTKAIKFLSGLHSSILKAKTKAIRWLKRKGHGKVADDMDDMSANEWQAFLSNKVYEEKLREQIRSIIKEVTNG